MTNKIDKTGLNQAIAVIFIFFMLYNSFEEIETSLLVFAAYILFDTVMLTLYPNFYKDHLSIAYNVTKNAKRAYVYVAITFVFLDALVAFIVNLLHLTFTYFTSESLTLWIIPLLIVGWLSQTAEA